METLSLKLSCQCTWPMLLSLHTIYTVACGPLSYDVMTLFNAWMDFASRSPSSKWWIVFSKCCSWFCTQWTCMLTNTPIEHGLVIHWMIITFALGRNYTLMVSYIYTSNAIYSSSFTLDFGSGCIEGEWNQSADFWYTYTLIWDEDDQYLYQQCYQLA